MDGVASTGDLDPLEASRLAEAGAMLLDVREDDEWEAGHASQAVHLPMSRLADRVGEVPTDRTVVCVCRSGHRSAAVAEALVRSGVDARNMAGGMVAWERAGLPITSDGAFAGRIV
jgi:rhodanese-related sulfurtransferase